MIIRKKLKLFLRSFIVTGLCLYIVFALSILVLKYWFLPQVDSYRPDLEKVLSERLGTPVKIGGLDVVWQGWNPAFFLTDVRLGRSNDKSGLTFSRLDAALSWSSLWHGQPIFSSITIYQPSLRLRRDAQQRFWLGDISWTFHETNENNQALPWLLSQGQISIRQAQLTWVDESRSAPELQIKNVDFVLQNSGLTHRFLLRGEPPSTMAQPYEFRAVFKHKLFVKNWYDFETWRGEAYAQINNFHMLSWTPWVDIPTESQQSVGSVRVWLGFDEGKVNSATADVNAMNVGGRLQDGASPLMLANVQGRLSAQYFSPTQQWAFGAKQLRIRTTAHHDYIFPSMRFALPASAQSSAPFELSADYLNLSLLGEVATSLPLEKSQRETLQHLKPQGTLRDVKAVWAWGGKQELVRLNAQAQFTNLGLVARQDQRGELLSPGVKNVSGKLRASLKGLELTLQSKQVELVLPGIFSQPQVQLDRLDSLVHVRHSSSQGLKVQIVSAMIKQGILEGKLQGSWSSEGQSPAGTLDLEGRLNRVYAKDVPPLIPTSVGHDTKQWLDAAFSKGELKDVQFKVKGDLDNFPFEKDRTGMFWVQGQLDHVDLHFSPLDASPPWPNINNVSGMITFDRDTIRVVADKGDVTVKGANTLNIGKTVATVSSLSHNATLNLQGSSSGDINAFFRYVEQSPINHMTDEILYGVQGTGNATLKLDLVLPLTHSIDARVNGQVLLQNNKVKWRARLPDLESVQGRVDFNEHGVTIPGIKAIVLGKPVTAKSSVATNPNSKIEVVGELDWGRLGSFLEIPKQYMSGVARVTGFVQPRAKGALDLSFVADVSRSALNLPVSFSRSVGSMKKLNTQILYQDDVWKVDAQIDDFFKIQTWVRTDKSFEVKKLSAAWDSKLLPIKDDTWLFAFNLPEMGGAVEWLTTSGQSHLTASLDHITWSNNSVDATTAIDHQFERVSEEWLYQFDSVDVGLRHLKINDQFLGAWELSATQQPNQDWLIKHLKGSVVGGVLQGSGRWTKTGGTYIDLDLTIMNAGNMLDDLGFKRLLKNGSGDVVGHLSWRGGPLSFSRSALQGQLQLELNQGQFLKADPGAAKLLGVLSLQSLPRRLSLDFKDLFGEGFAFDTVRAHVKVNQGVLSTEDFKMAGPVALVLISGQTNLVKENQDLKVLVVPRLDASLPSLVYGAMINPAIGVAAFLAQYVFSDSISKMMSYEMVLRGTWIDPIVEQVNKHQHVE